MGASCPSAFKKEALLGPLKVSLLIFLVSAFSSLAHAAAREVKEGREATF